MQDTVQTTQQEEQLAPHATVSWRERRQEAKRARQQDRAAKRQEKRDQESALATFDLTRTEPESFYERAIEWTHRADKIINLVLGYLLAVASVLGFMDVLSNGEVLGHVPFLFYIWLLIMGLGVDFQILLVIGRVPDLARMVGHPVGKWILVIFNIAFLAFLAYVSIVIGAVFTQHRDVPGTITQAMGVLGINSTSFVYERATLATFLLILMAVDRTMERWRMQIAAGNRQQQREANNVEVTEKQANVVTLVEQNKQSSEMAQVIKAMQEMNTQNLAAMQAMNNETLERFSRVTAEMVRETVEHTTATVTLPGFARRALPPGITQDENDLERNTGALRSIDLNGANEQRMRYYGELIEAIYRGNPEVKISEIVDKVGCSRATASRWLKQVKTSVTQEN
ncbi:hypothetical protein [Ktedonospora formicarum]|uniref:Uncharacterized protein n=1 Tax=Ktedonospora formicarum TaxID=2778364 RepID=A0A8J3I107_9CHLR|nr:hypothetical protein [Ktedonospora formicarum]GHO46821.1 hypothetical protein KSX_49840 [Ktedonospora formicarum]